MLDKLLRFLRSKFLNIVILSTVLSTFSFAFYAVWKYWNQFHIYGLSESTEKWGQFGDFVGGTLNPLLGLASIIIVCVTLYTTSKFGAKQSFETLLFELIKIHRENLFSIEIVYPENSVKGRQCFDDFLSEIRWNYNHELYDLLGTNSATRLTDSINKFFDDFNNQNELGHYYRNLYLIFKHIDESYILSKAEKSKYAKIVRAQMSSAETNFLFFNCMSTRGASFKRFIEEYSLLQGLSLELIGSLGVNSAMLSAVFNEKAYKDN
ncbi:putative phage abortive infection protein [Pantoea agglomerans]|uniref:putative phage abortive infection protein n=1 Tax=Enterobacter agglomerans TaxID=549 RepID=UPI003C7DB7CF